MFSITKLHPDSRFYYQPGSLGVESTFDIVFEDTGDAERNRSRHPAAGRGTRPALQARWVSVGGCPPEARRRT